MLDIVTKYATFSKFQDVLTFMKEENLKEIEVFDVKYCLDSIVGKGIYSVEQIQNIVDGCARD